MLTQAQISDFWKNGFVVIDAALDEMALNPLRDDFEAWVD